MNWHMKEDINFVFCYGYHLKLVARILGLLETSANQSVVIVVIFAYSYLGSFNLVVG